MTPTEAAALLAVAAAFDNRKPDADAAQAWSLALDGLRFIDCRDAIVAHYRVSTEWLMPAMVRREVKAIRHNRLMEFGPFDPPAELESADYSRWLGDTRRRIADGELTDPAELAAINAKPRHMPDLADLLPAVPPLDYHEHAEQARAALRGAKGDEPA